MERQIILDTETTGLDPSKGHRIIEIGCLEMINRRLTGKKFHCYINPEREVDPGATQISGITNEFLKDKPLFTDIMDDFLGFIEGAELIIHNAPFDVGFINAEIALAQHFWGSIDSYVRIFDTLLLARQLHPGQRNSLDALCRRYGVDNAHRTYHGALLDAEILSLVYLAMTAGQTQLALGEDEDEGPAALGMRTRKARAKLKRDKNFTLTIIKADSEENRLHEERLLRLTKTLN